MRLASPLVLAAGTHGTLDEIGAHVDLSRVGAIVTKSITVEAREGNPGVRVVPLRVGMLNAVGLANPGLDAFVREYGPRIARLETRVIVSIAGTSIDEYVELARAMERVEGVDGVELNVSCPNVKGGTEFGVDPEALGELVGRVRRELVRTRLLVKLSPIVLGKVTIVDVARAAIEGLGEAGGACARPGADALTVGNTVPAMWFDLETGRPALRAGTGGLSGAAILPIMLRLVHQVHESAAREAGVDIIGLGGVSSWRDAAQMLLAGASCVGVGTITLADLRSVERIRRGLERWARRTAWGRAGPHASQS